MNGSCNVFILVSVIPTTVVSFSMYSCQKITKPFGLDLRMKIAFSALTLLVGWQEGHLACKKQWWGAGMVICLERGADFRMAQLMPLPLTVSCFSKIQTVFTFLVPANPGCPGKWAVKRVFVCVCIKAMCWQLLFLCERCNVRLCVKTQVKSLQTSSSIISLLLLAAFMPKATYGIWASWMKTGQSSVVAFSFFFCCF